MDDWVVLSDGSGSDTVSDDGSESGFAILRGRSDDGDRRAEHVPPVDDNVVVTEAPTSPPRAAVPQPTLPGSFKVVSYGDAFKASSSRDASDGDEADEEGDRGVEESDLDEDEEALDAIAGLWISYVSGSSSEEDDGDHVPSDGSGKGVELKAPSESGSVERHDPEIPYAVESDNDDDCFDLNADLLTSKTEHIARDGGEELEATASNADEELSGHRGGSYDDIDDGSDVEKYNTYGYIDIVPSPIRPAPIHYHGRTGCIACDGGEAKAAVGGGAEGRRGPARCYDDIDTSDEEEESYESDYEEEDDDCDGSKVEDCSCTEERSCDEDDEDSDIDSSEAEESDDDNSSDISDMGDSSDEDDETCSCNGGESSCDEDDDDACSSDEEESRREDDHEDSDSSEDEESNYNEDGSSVSSNMEDSCDDDTCSSDEEESSCDEDDEHSDTESSDEDEGSDSEEEDGTDSSGTTQSDCDDEEDDSDKSDATGIDSDDDDDITDDSAEEESGCEEENDTRCFESGVDEDDRDEDDYYSGSSDEELKGMSDCCYSARRAYAYNVGLRANAISHGVEEAPAFAACGRSREERPTGPASEVKQREEARETLDDALARVAAAAAESALRQGSSFTATTQGCGIGGRHDVEEALAFAACGRSREERPTGPAAEVKQREEARETLDDALARVAAEALESAPPRPRAVASGGASWRPPMPARRRARATRLRRTSGSGPVDPSSRGEPNLSSMRLR